MTACGFMRAPGAEVSYVNGSSFFQSRILANHSLRGEERMSGSIDPRFAATSPMIGIWQSTTLLTFLGKTSKWMMPPLPCAAAARAAGANARE